MTVAIAVVCSDGVIVAADSMSSDGAIAARSQKVHVASELPLVWTAAGSQYAIEEVSAELVKMESELKPVDLGAFTKPETESIRLKLGQRTRNGLNRAYKTAVPHGAAQCIPGTTVHPFNTSCLFAGYGREGGYLLEVSHDGQMNWHTPRGFYAVGSGGPFASVARALHEHLLDEGPIELRLGLQLAYRTIETTCEVSTSNVGLPVQLAVVDSEGARVLDEDELEQVQTGVAAWKQSERDAFRGKASEPHGGIETPPELDRESAS